MSFTKYYSTSRTGRRQSIELIPFLLQTSSLWFSVVFGPVLVSSSSPQLQADSPPEVWLEFFISILKIISDVPVRPVCHYTGCFMVLLSQQIDRTSCNDALQYNTRVILSPDGLSSLLISPALALRCYDAYYILSIELL